MALGLIERVRGFASSSEGQNAIGDAIDNTVIAGAIVGYCILQGKTEYPGETTPKTLKALYAGMIALPSALLAAETVLAVTMGESTDQPEQI